MNRVLRVRFFMLIAALIIGVGTGVSAENALPDDFFSSLKIQAGEQPDSGWVEQFRSSFQIRFARSNVSPSTVRLMMQVLSGSVFPADPVEGANRFFTAVRDADRQLKMGKLPQEVGSQMLSRWQRMLRTGGNNGGRDEAQQIRSQMLERIKNRGRAFPVPGNHSTVDQGKEGQSGAQTDGGHSGAGNRP